MSSPRQRNKLRVHCDRVLSDWAARRHEPVTGSRLKPRKRPRRERGHNG